MKLIVKNDRVIATATDQYPGPDQCIDAPDDFDVARMGEYVVVNGVAEIPDPTEDQIREASREERNRRLAECDWTQLGDVNLTTDCKAAFATYRQALRDADMLNPVWPATPVEEWAA